MPEQNTETVTPPNPNPDPNPNPTTDSPNPPSNPPTNQPRVFSDADMTRTHELYGEALREQTARNEKLERELAEARRTSPQQPVDDSNLTPEQLIDRAVQRSVKPLIDDFTLFRQSQQANTYRDLKNQFRTMPQLAPFFTQLEPYIDQEMQGKEVTVQALHNAIAIVIGKIQMQNTLQPVQQQPVTQQQPQNPPVNNNQPRNDNMLPPHLRPSNPPAPTGNGNVQLRQLTELEKRVARERGMSDEQYLAWIDVDPRDVVRSNIGRPTT